MELRQLKSVSLASKIFMVVSLLLPLSAVASDAYIDTGSTRGQGYLFMDADTCFLVTPAHVAKSSNELSFLAVDRKSHVAKKVKEFDVDLALYELEKSNLCRSLPEYGSTRLSALLKIYRDGVIKTRLSDASVLQTKIEITGIDESYYLQVRVRSSSDTLKQGFSGSQLFVAEQPAGILIEVDEDGYGYVLRSDAIEKLLNGSVPKESTIKFSIINLIIIHYSLSIIHYLVT